MSILPARSHRSVARRRSECDALRGRIAGYLAQKPPRVKAAGACILRLHDLTIGLLKHEIRQERKARLS